ncbi:MAG: rod shape-determining protein MreC [Muribaculaceae bacterium]|nr:rod shape-determining protein MreC [Muribaculaceae bacterium]
MKYSTAMLFIVLVLISCTLLFTGNTYQESVYLTSANRVSSSIYGVSQGVTGYFNLRSINEDLQRRNALLENEVLNLKNAIGNLNTLVPMDSAEAQRLQAHRYDFVSASVINNSVNRPRNYFTVNRGSDDGVRPGMGVVSQNGIVGIVNVTGRHTARIISLLNVTQIFSVKVKGTNSVGSLIWKEGNPSIAFVTEMPRHVKYHVGDTIVTSGYSNTFPEGIPVGIVMAQVRASDDNFFTLKVKLASDFNELSTVRIIRDMYKSELDSLNQFDSKEE